MGFGHFSESIHVDCADQLASLTSRAAHLCWIAMAVLRSRIVSFVETLRISLGSSLRDKYLHPVGRIRTARTASLTSPLSGMDARGVSHRLASFSCRAGGCVLPGFYSCRICTAFNGARPIGETLGSCGLELLESSPATARAKPLLPGVLILTLSQWRRFTIKPLNRDLIRR